MDPVGPWSAYASYNRLAGVQTSSSGGELHHSLSSSTPAAPPTTASQLLPSGFLSATPVGYDGVFSPLFHHANVKHSHYMTQQHRQAITQATGSKVEPDYPQSQSFFEQNSNWQQNSPFGILPHESVVTTTASKSYDSYNHHFPVQSVNQLSSKNASINRAHSPQVAATTTAKTQPSSFFPVAPTEAGASSSKPYMSPSASNIQQSCIVTSSITNNGASKDYHLPQNPAHPTYASSTPDPSLIEKPFNSAKPTLQTKAQAKIYPEVAGQTERQRSDEQSQNSPVSYSLIDPNRLGYTAGSNNKRGLGPNYRHYQNANSETDFQRGKDFPNNNSADCSVVVPRRPSPLQAHSQASPIGHAPSPAYPLYNSPMNSTLSSPQNSSHVTPPSPLDVSVSRSNSQNSPYPSVITRVLNSEKNYSDRFERNNQASWNERRKFNHFHIAGGNLDLSSRQIDVSTRSDAVGRQLIQGLNDRQQYFDSNDVPLQDLSSCRGDPMSIVKNLQQSCQVQPDIKVEIKTEKRRKSNDGLPDMSGRIPPPAHSSQNGVYFEFDRWNLPTPSSSKLYAAQAMQQHQNLMVAHPHPHHPPPPLPYFPPFHLPPHPSDYQSVDMASISSYNDQNASQSVAYHHVQEEHPKVVVPNIEEELNFLSESNLSRPAQVQSLNPSHMPKFMDKSVGQVGFMSSYLKFLQGEKDSSPPPAYRFGRKHSWRTKPMNEINLENNGINHHLQGTSLNYPIQRLSQGDPQDDPRYFPLPKERKENTFNSSDDGLSSDEDLFNKKSNMMSMVHKDPPIVEKKRKKGRPLKPGGPTEMRRLKQKLKEAARTEPKSEGVKTIPRRETSKRLAKEKINLQAFSKADDEFEEPQEFADSDSDPVWTPAVKLDAVDDTPVKKAKRGRPRKNVVKNLLGDGIGFKSQDIHSSSILGLNNINAIGKQDSNPALMNNLHAVTGQQLNFKGLPQEGNQFKNFKFQVGEFLVLKSNLQELWPPLWRVDGKNVIQKFEPFEDNGVTLYKNIPPLYNSWTMENNSQYITVPVKVRSQNPTEVVIEFLKNKLVVVDPTFVSNSMQESTSYQDNFEVYIQTLISQALDSNFLTEIFQENDDYFLSNVKIIDDVTSSKRQKLIDNLNWPPSVQIAVTTWPCFMMNEITNSYSGKNCAACDCAGVSARVLMYGQPYNVSTLEGCQPDPKAVNEKDFIMCRICANRVELFSKVAHQKYLMYLECAKRVAEKRTSDPRKDTTCILNELLADERWLNQLFYGVRNNWADVDSIEHSFKLVI